jgi:hypothetical protein
MLNLGILMERCNVRPLSRAVLPIDRMQLGWIEAHPTNIVFPKHLSLRYALRILTIVSITCPKLRVVGEGSACVFVLVSIFSKKTNCHPSYRILLR